ncbi:MAG: 3-isopropylmalate dehydratase small subunit [Acidaminobacteraceae bacterium]
MTGKIHKYGNNIDTDVIIPARYLTTVDKKELASHCMEDIDKDFVKRVAIGDYIVAGTNFGCGSSREHAPIAIKESGIKVVIAKSFARIFFRNSLNIGLTLIETDKIQDLVEMGDEISVDMDNGLIYVKDKETIDFQKPTDVLSRLVEEDGLVNYAKKYM